jgi:hypothetical protein
MELRILRAAAVLLLGTKMQHVARHQIPRLLREVMYPGPAGSAERHRDDAYISLDSLGVDVKICAAD